MNWKLILFVVFTFFFTIIMGAVQSIANIDVKYIILPQLAPALSYLIIILLFKKMFKPIIINFNKTIIEHIIIKPARRNSSLKLLFAP